MFRHITPAMHENSQLTVSPLLYFRSVRGQVSLVGSNDPWEGFQSEIDFFTFHAGRIGQLLEWGDAKRLAYQADGNSFGIARENESAASEFTGVFATGKLPFGEILAELM